MRSRDLSFLLLVLVLAGLAGWVVFAPADATGTQRVLGRDVSTRLGLDLQGGTQVLLRARNLPEDNTRANDAMESARGVIEQRVNGLGVSESVVQRSGDDRIIVELPGVQDPNQAVATIRSAGRLEFVADASGAGFDPNQAFQYIGQLVRTTNSPNPPIPQSAQTVTSTTSLSDTGTLSDTSAISTPTTLTEGPILQSITDGADLNISSVQPRVGAATGQINSSQYAVSFAFENESATQLAQFTSANVSRAMCIVLDNVVYSCPTIQSALVGGSGEITVGSREEMDSIYSRLKYGALPVSLDIETSRTVTASLGEDSVRASLIAGIVGLVVVALFMILYYRLPGVLATIALLIYTAFSFALYKFIPITLTLAGIAGFILSIGIAVDANVLIFARLKEELRAGLKLNRAIEAGFKEAWPAIRDSSAATIITSVILYTFGNSFGVSIIKGFALTLGLGIILSLFTAVVITRTLLRLIAPLPFAQNPWMFELEEAPGLDAARDQRTA